MKKFLFTFFILLVTVTNSNAQSFDLVRANKYFSKAIYTKAIPLYQKSLKDRQDYNALKNLADCYYNIYSMKQAAHYYGLLIKYYKKGVTEDYYIKYAHALKAVHKTDIANTVLKDYYQNNSKKLNELNQSIQYLDNVKAIGNRYTIKNLAINTEHSEFGAVKKENSLIFTAVKKENTTFEKPYRWDGEQYLDLYEIPLDQISLGNKSANNLSSKINTRLHESNAVFTKDGKTVFFTRNNFIHNKRGKDALKITHLQIFKAELMEGEWKNIQSLPFNKDGYSTEHPALSPDEKTLFFASDMEGGFGSFDIYYVNLYEDGTFSVPENLGATINTDKKEQFPFISKNNELYFSSNGHPGFGSLDVFVSTIKKGKFLKSNNVGLPVNSIRDDFSFNIDTETKGGYFASNRPNGKGKDDIYELVEQKPLIIENCKQIIDGTVTDLDTHKVLVNALVKIRANQQKTDSIYTDNSGRFSFHAECGTNYTIAASKEGSLENQTTISTTIVRNKIHNTSLALKSLNQIALENKVALEKKKVENLAREKKNLQIAAKKKKQKIIATIAKERNIVKEKGKILVKTEEINFDYKLWYLRRDAKTATDKVIALMKKYPKMIVELGTHSDIRGNDRYNLELSQKRANSVRTYFIEQGIKSHRITAIGYGETQPLVKCKTENSCSEEQHELNRRCEFIVKRIH